MVGRHQAAALLRVEIERVRRIEEADQSLAGIARELRLIGELGFASYFLTVQDIVRFARSQDPPILCQGCGSSVNSAVCYCLGITSVNPTEFDLLFELRSAAAAGAGAARAVAIRSEERTTSKAPR